MSKQIKHLQTLFNNPFVLGHVLYSFYKSLNVEHPQGIDKSVLLSYLVFPLSLYPASQEYLTQRRHPSSCLRIMAKEHNRLFGLHERIQEFRTMTNISMQHACDLEVLSVNPEQAVMVLSDWPDAFIALPHACKAAQRLGEFMSKQDIPSSYRMLGVRAL